MAQVRSWAGLDVHARKVVAVSVDGATGELAARGLPGDTRAVVEYCSGLPGPTRAAYEAGPTGFGLARRLRAAGVECVVAAPRKIERPAQDRVKTDRRDAERLVRLLMPILLAAFAVLGGVDDAQRIYGLVFIVVLASVAIQGTLVPEVASRLSIRMRVRDQLPWELSVRVGEEPTGAREVEVAEGSPADASAIGELDLGDDGWVTMIVRDGAALQPSKSLELRPGDRILLSRRPGGIRPD